MVTQLLWARDAFFYLPVLLTYRLAIRLWGWDRAEELFFLSIKGQWPRGGWGAGKSKISLENEMEKLIALLGKEPT